MKNVSSFSLLGSLTGGVLFLNFLTMPVAEYPGDAQSVRMETIVLLNRGQWAVPENVALQFGPRGSYFYQNKSGAWYPKYGVLNTLIYLPSFWLEKMVTGRVDFDTDHTIYLNLLNLLAAGLTALYLGFLARRYTDSKWIIALFVLGSIYATFWWNYLRAQAFETYLSVMFVALFYHLVQTRDGAGSEKRHLIGVAVSIACLALCKTVFLAIVPIIAALLFWKGAPSFQGWRTQLRLLWLPMIVSVAAVLAVNWYKFDSPFHTGYTQWANEEELFTANIWPALQGYIVGKQESLFIHFPLLLFAAVGWRFFFKENRVDAIAALSLCLPVLLLHAARPNWQGAPCYGPRYLLPIAPILAIPFLHLLNWSCQWRTRVGKIALLSVLCATLAYSIFLQIAMNSLPFYFYYDLMAVAEAPDESGPSDYLRAQHFGLVNVDFLRYARGGRSPFVEGVIDQLTPAGFARMEGLKVETRLNYYWYPRPVEGSP